MGFEIISLFEGNFLMAILIGFIDFIEVKILHKQYILRMKKFYINLRLICDCTFNKDKQIAFRIIIVRIFNVQCP